MAGQARGESASSPPSTDDSAETEEAKDRSLTPPIEVSVTSTDESVESTGKTFTCSLCCEEVPSNLVTRLSCDHEVCTACLTTWIARAERRPNSGGANCPYCRTALSDEELTNSLGRPFRPAPAASPQPAQSRLTVQARAELVARQRRLERRRTPMSRKQKVGLGFVAFMLAITPLLGIIFRYTIEEKPPDHGDCIQKPWRRPWNSPCEVARLVQITSPGPSVSPSVSSSPSQSSKPSFLRQSGSPSSMNASRRSNQPY